MQTFRKRRAGLSATAGLSCLYWYWYGPYLYEKVLILVLVILFEPRSIQYFSAIPAPLSLTICQSLATALLDGINSRVGTVFDDTKVQLASAVHPKFKLDWVENQVEKSLVVEQLKRAVEVEHQRKETQQDCPTAVARESHQDHT